MGPDVFDQPLVVLVQAVQLWPVLQPLTVTHLQLFLLFDEHVQEGVDNLATFTSPRVPGDDIM